jgi:hypothetical protein
MANKQEKNQEKIMAKVVRITSIESARKYWDSHGVDEVPGEEVEIEVRQPLSHVLSVRLDNDDFQTLKAMAKSKKIGMTTLARQLLHEALAVNRSSGKDAGGWVVKLDLSKRQLNHIAARISGTQRPKKKRQVPA